MISKEPNHQRISFSSDLGQSDKPPPQSGLMRRDETLLDSSNSFEFRISNNFDPGDSSPADEIFADGMILPFHVTAATTAPKRLYKYELPPISTSSLSPSPLPPQHSHVKQTEKESANSDSSEAEKSSPSKSFWSFKRSSSLNCDIKKSRICSFPRLTRSNSTGSVTNLKRAMLRDVNNRHKPSLTTTTTTSSICCNAYQLRPQKHVANGSSTFGLGSILRHWKDKTKKSKK